MNPVPNFLETAPDCCHSFGLKIHWWLIRHQTMAPVMFLPKTEQDMALERGGLRPKENSLTLNKPQDTAVLLEERQNLTFTRNIRRKDSTHVPRNEPLDIQILEKDVLAQWTLQTPLCPQPQTTCAPSCKESSRTPFSSDTRNIIRSSWLVALS